MVHEAGWNPRQDWTGTDNFALTRFRSQHRPLRRDSLYRLSYPGPLTGYYGLLYLLELLPYEQSNTLLIHECIPSVIVF